MRTAYGLPIPDEDTARGAAALLAAVRDGEQLVSWAQPNAAVLAVPTMARLVARGLRAESEIAFGVPMLRYANPDLAPVPLLQAVVLGRPSSVAACDQCGHGPGQHRLLVPQGATVVAVHMCGWCRSVLDEARPTARLVWG